MIKSIFNLVEYKAIALLYIIVSANFIANIFSCDLQQMLTDNQVAKHIIGFITLFFCITLVSPSDATGDSLIFVKKLLASLLLYILFILSTKTNGAMAIIILSILGVIYMTNAYKDTLDKTIFGDRINKINQFLKLCAVILTVVLVYGVISYYKEKRLEYNENFSNTTFLVGNVECRRN